MRTATLNYNSRLLMSSTLLLAMVVTSWWTLPSGANACEPCEGTTKVCTDCDDGEQDCFECENTGCVERGCNWGGGNCVLLGTRPCYLPSPNEPRCIYFPEFLAAALDALIPEGGATSIDIGRHVLRLTADPNQFGRAFFETPLIFGPDDDASFGTSFSFWIRGEGGNGIAFVVTTNQVTAEGSDDGDMGYLNITPSLVVEFDTVCPFGKRA